MSESVTCPKCGDEVEICDNCGDIIHFEQSKVWMSGGVFCGRCHRKMLGRCTRKRLDRVDARST